MTIDHARTDKTTVVLTLTGKLDTASSPLLEQKIKQWGNDIREIILDFAGLSYISSMGLRVLLHAKKEMKQEGRKLTIKNMGASIREVFEMTGFMQLMVDEEKFVIVRKDDPADSKTVVLLFHGKMQSEHSQMLSTELVKIKEDYVLQHGHVTVILDMENLTFISPGAIKSLQQTLTETNWESRKIRIQNVSADVRSALEKNGMGNIL